MTKLAMSLALVFVAFGVTVPVQADFELDIPADTVTVHGPDGTAVMVSQANGAVTAEIHLPVIGKVWSKTVSEACDLTIDDEIEGDSVRGQFMVS